MEQDLQEEWVDALGNLSGTALANFGRDVIRAGGLTRLDSA